MAKATTAEAKTQDAEAKSAQADAKVKIAEAKVLEAEAKTKDAEAATLKVVSSLREQLSAAHAKVTTAEARSKESEAKTKDLEAKLAQADANVKVAEGKTGEAETKAAKADAKTMEAENKLEQAEERIAKAASVDATSKLTEEKELRHDEKLSVLGIVSTAGSIARDVAQYMLAQTDVDDQAMKLISDKLGVAKAFMVDISGQVAAYDFKAKLTSHQLFVQHVAPVMSALAETAQPYVEKSFSSAKPFMEEVKASAEPKVTKAKEAFKAVEGNAFTKLDRIGSEFRRSVREGRDKFIEPIFSTIASASPAHRDLLPQNPYDQVLLLVIGAVCAFCATRILLSFLKALRATTWMTCKLAVRLIVLATNVLSYALWLATGFYCCGFCRCRRREVAKQLEDCAKEASSHTKESNKDDEGNAIEMLTTDETEQLLDRSRKKGSLEAGAKMLAGIAGSGKALEGKKYPECVHGKQLQKDVFKKALSKFKGLEAYLIQELDPKNLGL